MASAADILRKAPPPALLPPPIQDWSGVYVGVEGGYGWGHQSLSSNVPFLLTPNDTICQSLDGDFFKHDCNSFREFNDFQRDFGGFTTGSGDASNPIIPFSGHNQSGGVIGGFFGVQKQWGSWVLGFEGSVDYANIKGSGTGPSSTHLFSTGTLGSACGSEGLPGCERRFTAKSATAGSFNTTIDTIGAVNAKIGYAFSPQWLIYGTGGMAFAHEKNSFSFSNSLFHLDCDTSDPTVCNGNSGFVDLNAANADSGDGFIRFANRSFAGSGGTSMFGWTAGAGVDFKVQIDPGSAWVFGVDYKHYGFGHHTLSLAGVDGGTFSVDSTQSVDVIRGRLSYLFSIH